MRNPAPIVLFIYNRPQHLRACLESLTKNEEAAHSKLFIFADGPKPNATPEQLEKIRQARAVAHERKWAGEVQVIEKEGNMGLSEAIIRGVKQVIDEYGKVIVLEDDFILGKYFLKYMNDALDKYEQTTEVAQIAGFLFPIKTQKSNEAFLIPLGTTWGWATWKRVWDAVDFYPNDYMVLAKDRKLSRAFDLDNSYPYTKMMFRQMMNPNFGSWGIRFWWHMFKEKSLVVYPDYPLLQHGDKDLSGTHRSNFDFMDQPNWNGEYLISGFPDEIALNTAYFKKIKSFIRFHTGILGKLIQFIGNPKAAVQKLIER